MVKKTAEEMFLEVKESQINRHRQRKTMERSSKSDQEE